ncbi:MAG: helix-turn-helix transcriptional regulator [Flavobacteriales bacterium]|nr:helix-turn-helix transcriptional regulator [Flavobacteriales bacterium]
MAGVKKLIIRNMVCDRCISSVRAVLDGLCIEYKQIQLGEVSLAKAVDAATLQRLDFALVKAGFERLDDRRQKVVERVKHLVMDRVRSDQGDRSDRKKLSEELANDLHMEYSSLSKLFSASAGVTIERYYNLHRIERAKELLVYDELSLGQIADMLGYSSVQHLSNQFSQHVGFSPSHFKRIGAERRVGLDKVGT